MKFRKLVVYDTKDSVLSGKLKPFCEELVVIKTPKDYSGTLKPSDLAGADAFVCKMFEKYGESFLSGASDLKYIGVSSTGYDAFDVDYIKSRGITITNVPGYSAPAVAELSFSALLNIVRKTNIAFEETKKGIYAVDKYYQWELKGKTFGVIGLGHIGRSAARIAKGFGMKLIYYSRSRKPDAEKELGIEYRELDELIQEADVISINVSLNEETRNLINAERLASMKDGAIVLNSTRCHVCDIDAIANFRGNVRFWFDTLDHDAERKKIGGLDNVFMTPHVGWLTKEAIERLDRITVENIEAFLQGKPKNIIE